MNRIQIFFFVATALCCRVFAAALLAALLPVAEIRAQDTDGDFMPDSYELFYGLDPSTNDAALDYEGDGFSNLEESRILTDPFSPDTDFDGWNDDFDEVPISRAYLPFGVPLFTHGDFCDYARPDWCVGCWKTGGSWFYTTEESGATNQSGFLSGWQISASESNHASLSVAIDRAILTNNLVYALHYLGSTNASLYADLLSSDRVVVAEDLYGNLLAGSNAAGYAVIPAQAGIQPNSVVLLLNIPTAIFPDASILQLRRGEGEIIVYEGLLYISEDGDELDADQERQLGTSDYSIDSNGNGISDYAEWLNSTSGGSSTNLPGGGGGGSTNDTDGGTSAATGLIFVSQSVGSDMLTGRAPEVRGNDGPKKTISQGLAAVDRDGAHTLIIKSGNYGEDLDLRGKGVKVVIEGRVKL